MSNKKSEICGQKDPEADIETTETCTDNSHSQDQSSNYGSEGVIDESLLADIREIPQSSSDSFSSSSSFIFEAPCSRTIDDIVEILRKIPTNVTELNFNNPNSMSSSSLNSSGFFSTTSSSSSTISNAISEPDPEDSPPPPEDSDSEGSPQVYVRKRDMRKL